MSFWKNKKVLLAGANGFLGSHVKEALGREGCESIWTPTREQFDLRIDQNARLALMKAAPDVIINCAGTCYGIQGNLNNAGSMFYDNMAISMNLIHTAMLLNVPRYVEIGTACAYSSECELPFSEPDYERGMPERSNGPYAVAKRSAYTMLAAYQKQYDLNGIYLILDNLYGPRDNFGLETAHVIPTMIRKFLSRGTVHFMGDGSAIREFLYVEDAATDILIAAEKYHSEGPINIPGAESISIKDLAEEVKTLTGYQGPYYWDKSAPNGQPERRLSWKKHSKVLGVRPRLPLTVGLERTIEWAKANLK